MSAFWPGPGWEPWDSLTTAGYRVTNDRRSTAPPVVLMEVEREQVTGAAGDGCVVVEGSVKAAVLPPGPDVADARKWAWTGPVAVLLPYADNEGAVAGEFEELPSVDLLIPFTYNLEV